jgi:hypothetical protein
MVPKEKAMNASEKPTELLASDPNFVSWVWLPASSALPARESSSARVLPSMPRVDVLKPLRHLLSDLDVRQEQRAHKICQLIPSQCPFERTVRLFGRTLFHIPPLCKLNPLYEDLIALRFRALCYLADECGEDITPYC